MTHLLEVRASVAALFVALTRAGLLEEARDFAEWAIDNLDQLENLEEELEQEP